MNAKEGLMKEVIVSGCKSVNRGCQCQCIQYNCHIHIHINEDMIERVDVVEEGARARGDMNGNNSDRQHGQHGVLSSVRVRQPYQSAW